MWPLKFWGWLKGWGKYVVFILAALIPVVGWALERRGHKHTKLERDAAQDAAKRNAAIANAEAKARMAAAEATKKWRERYEVIEAARIVAEEEAAETEARIDEHAGDVGEVANDLNEELGLPE